MELKYETYEEVARYLLDRFCSEFGLERVEPKQKAQGLRSGTAWELDAKGIKIGGEGFLIIECRRYQSSRLKQEALGAVAYRIMDTGASGAIVVSPLDLQHGATLVAGAEGITHVKLAPDSTTHEYVLSFLNRVMIGFQEDVVRPTDSVSITITKKDGTVEHQDFG